MAEINLITQYNKKSPISEAYRAIRTNLQFAGAGKPMKLISFTSATPSEGKSTTVSNLAIVMKCLNGILNQFCYSLHILNHSRFL